MQFFKTRFFLATRAGAAVAAPAPVDAAITKANIASDLPLRCNTENLSVDSMNTIARSLSLDSTTTCPSSDKNAPWLSYHIAEYGSGAAHVAVSTRTLDLEYEETSCNNVAGAIDDIVNNCGSLGGSTLATASGNIVVHVDSDFVG